MEKSKSVMSKVLQSRVIAHDHKIESLTVQIRELALSVNSLQQRFKELPQSLEKMTYAHQKRENLHRSELDAKNSPIRGSDVTGRYNSDKISMHLGSNSSIVYNRLPHEIGSPNQKESVGVYIEEFEAYSAKIPIQSDKQLLILFLRGLQLEIRIWLRDLLLSTYAQAKVFARKVELVKSWSADQSIPKVKQVCSPNSDSSEIVHSHSWISTYCDEEAKLDSTDCDPLCADQFTSHVEEDEPSQEDKLFDGSPIPYSIKDKPLKLSNYSFFHNTRYAFDVHGSQNSNNLNSQLSYLSNQLTFTPKIPQDPHVRNQWNGIMHQKNYNLMINDSQCLVSCGAHQLTDEGQYIKLYGVEYAMLGRKPLKPPDYVKFLASLCAIHDYQLPRPPKLFHHSQNSMVQKEKQISIWLTNNEMQAVKSRMKIGNYVFKSGGISFTVGQNLGWIYKILVPNMIQCNVMHEIKDNSSSIVDWLDASFSEYEGVEQLKGRQVLEQLTKVSERAKRETLTKDIDSGQQEKKRTNSRNGKGLFYRKKNGSMMFLVGPWNLLDWAGDKMFGIEPYEQVKNRIERGTCISVHERKELPARFPSDMVLKDGAVGKSKIGKKKNTIKDVPHATKPASKKGIIAGNWIYLLYTSKMLINWPATHFDQYTYRSSIHHSLFYFFCFSKLISIRKSEK